MNVSYRMTPKRRFISGIFGGRVDKPPIGSVTSVTNLEQMEIKGAYFPDVHLDSERMALLAGGAHDILKFEEVKKALVGTFKEAEYQMIFQEELEKIINNLKKKASIHYYNEEYKE